MKRIRITAKAREIMAELVELYEKFHEHTRILADRSTDNSTAMNVGADREAIRTQILGAAWRLTKEITGEADRG